MVFVRVILGVNTVWIRYGCGMVCWREWGKRVVLKVWEFFVVGITKIVKIGGLWG
jgi:hypothetical protein